MTDKDKFIQFIQSQIGKPYELGAEGPDKFDCSGLIYKALAELNCAILPRLSTDQFVLGQEIPLSQAQEGDLIFFDTGWTDRVPNHNGVCISSTNMINANSYYNSILEEAFASGYWSDKIYGNPRRIFDNAGNLDLKTDDQSFSDVGTSHEFYAYIENLAEKRVIKGFPDGTYKPEFDINRAECLKIILLALGIDIPDEHDALSFSDLGEGKWYDKYVAEALSRDIVNGYPDGTFKPNKSINRAEMCKIIFLAGNENPPNPGNSPFSDINMEHWYAPYVIKANEWDMFAPVSSSTFVPNKKVTRGEMAKAIVNFLSQT